MCRQERVGLGMADGLSRVSNGAKIGVFAMQAGPGAENAFAGVSTAYADSSPLLVLPSGYARDREGWPRYFTAERGYRNVTKWLETVNVPEQTEGRDAPRLLQASQRQARPRDGRAADGRGGAGRWRDWLRAGHVDARPRRPARRGARRPRPSPTPTLR